MSARDLEDFISVIETAEKISRSSTALSTLDSYYPGRSSLQSSCPTSSAVSSDSRSTWSSRVSGVSSSVSTSIESVPTVRESTALDLIQLQRIHRHPRVIARDLSPAVTPQSSPILKKKTLRKRPSFLNDLTPQSSPERAQRKSLLGRQKTFAVRSKSTSSSSNSSPVKECSAPNARKNETDTIQNILEKTADPEPSQTTSNGNESSVAAPNSTPSALESSLTSPQKSPTLPNPALPEISSQGSNNQSPLISPRKSSIGSSCQSSLVSPKKSPGGSSNQSPLISSKKSSKASSNQSPQLSPKKSSSDSSNQSPLKSPAKSFGGSSRPTPRIISENSSVASSRQSPAKSPSITDDSFEELEPRTEIPVPRQRIVIRQSSIRVHDHTLQDVPSVSPVPSPRLEKKKRPISAPPPKARPPKSESEEQVDLRSYSKSLKLLGLNIPSNRVEATPLTHQDLEIRTKSPTLKTRLTKRTQSISDLQELIDSKEKISKKEYVQIKKPLCKAVFEEWYFKKMQVELEKRRKEEEIKQEKEYEEELEKESKKEKCFEEYKKWLMKKKLENNRLKKDRNNVKAGKGRRLLTEDQKKKMEEKLKEWKDTKMKELKKRKQREEDQRKAKEEEELNLQMKKEKAAQEFKAWRDKLNDQMRAKMKEERVKALEELFKRKEEAKEKREAAEAAFAYWKKFKDEIREKEINRLKRKQSKVASAETNSESMRQKEAQIAYEKWLEYTEQREIEEKLLEEEQNLRYLWRPPWYPGGISEY